MLNAAVIGVGSMGQNHARIYAELDNTELIAVSDISEGNRVRIAKKYKTKGYEDYNEMLKNEKIDLVSIASPTSMHKEIAINAMNAGKHVLLEKPIASSEEEAKEIIECAEKNNVKLMIGHIERFNPAIIEMKKLLEEKKLGNIYKVDVERIGPFPTRINDVGVIIDLSVHDLDIIHYLIGLPAKKVYAEVQQKIHPKFEDSVTSIIKYDGGVLGILNINYLSPQKKRRISVFGEKGMYSANYLTQDLYFYENSSFNGGDGFADRVLNISEGNMTKMRINKMEPLKAEIIEFIRCVSEDGTPLVTGNCGLNALKMANLLIKSASEGNPVKLE